MMRSITLAASAVLVALAMTPSAQAGYCPAKQRVGGYDNHYVRPACPVVRQRVQVNPRPRAYYRDRPVTRRAYVAPNPCGSPCNPPARVANPCGSPCAQSESRVNLVAGNAVRLPGIACQMPDGRMGIDINGMGCLARR